MKKKENEAKTLSLSGPYVIKVTLELLHLYNVYRIYEPIMSVMVG